MVKEKQRTISPHFPKSKKIKVGTILDRDIFQQLKEHAAREGRTISALIEEAVIRYNQVSPETIEKQKQAMERFLSHRSSLTADEWDEIMEEDVYDQ